jgi:hypothetical protein
MNDDSPHVIKMLGPAIYAIVPTVGDAAYLELRDDALDNAAAWDLAYPENAPHYVVRYTLANTVRIPKAARMRGAEAAVRIAKADRHRP